MICTSNTCRSPMAEYLARQWFMRNDMKNYTVISRALTDRYEPPGEAKHNRILNTLLFTQHPLTHVCIVQDHLLLKMVSS